MSSRFAFRCLGVCVALCLALLAPACFGVTRQFSGTYPLLADGSFELNNVNGSVRIEGWDRNEVEVRAVKRTPDDASALDLVGIDVEASLESIAVATHYPQDQGVEVVVDYVIHVPRHAQLTHINTVNGTLRVVNSEGLGDLHTVNGNIEVYEGAGNVHAHTTNGNVYLELKQPGAERGAFAETTNGSVLLAVPADLGAELEARCMNGNFLSELPLMLRGADQPRVVHGKLGRGGTPIHLGTVNGTIRIVALRSTV